MEEATTIGPGRRRWKRFLIPAAWIFASYVLVIIFLCAFFDVRCLSDLWAYRCMMEGPLHPAWKDLALRRIHKGSDLAQIVRERPPMKRQEYGPYTLLSSCEAGKPGNTLYFVATGGELVCAEAAGFWRIGSRWGRWGYVFFSDPTHVRLFEEARERHLDQVRLEQDAWLIHRAIAAGQDVVLCRQIERRESDGEPGYDDETMRMYEQIYGRDALTSMLGLRCELTVEISQSLSGDLKPGTQLTLSVDRCSQDDLAEPELVFLHGEEGEPYVLVPKKALEWYQSLTPDAVKHFEARCLVGTDQ